MRWFRLYAELLHDPKVQTLSAEDFKAYINALCLACQEGGSFTSEALQWASRCDADTVTRLVTAGLIVRRHSDRLAPHNWAKRQFKSDTSADRTRRWRERKRDVTVTPPEYREQNTEIPPKGSPVTGVTDCQPKGGRSRGSVARQRRGDVRYTERFERFWAAYPRKQAKAAAFEAFQKFDEEAQEGAVMAAPFFAQEMQEEGRPIDKIPHGSTWLNQRRFLDYVDLEYDDAEDENAAARGSDDNADRTADGGDVQSSGVAAGEGAQDHSRRGSGVRDASSAQRGRRACLGGHGRATARDGGEFAPGGEGDPGTMY